MSNSKNDHVKIRHFPGDVPRRLKLPVFEADHKQVEKDRPYWVETDLDIEKICKNYKKDHLRQALKRRRRADREALNAYSGDEE